jgi:hypothetical protein
MKKYCAAHEHIVKMYSCKLPCMPAHSECNLQRTQVHPKYLSMVVQLAGQPVVIYNHAPHIPTHTPDGLASVHNVLVKSDTALCVTDHLKHRNSQYWAYTGVNILNLFLPSLGSQTWKMHSKPSCTPNIIWEVLNETTYTPKPC